MRNASLVDIPAQLHTRTAIQHVQSMVGESAIGSNTSTSRNSAINNTLTIHFNAWSLRAHSPFSIQGPRLWAWFSLPIRQHWSTAHFGFFKVDITTDGNQCRQLGCKNYSHYSTDWPLVHLSVVGISWFGRYLYTHRTKSPSQCQRWSACFLVVSI